MTDPNTQSALSDRLMQDFYVSASYDPKAERPADVVKAAIEFALSAHPPATGEAVAWSCKACNSPRPGTDTCWKCGGPLKKPADGWEWPGLPDIARIRALAKEVGYAVGVHGSQERDLDLIAAPWVDGAVEPLALAEHIATGLGGQVVDFKNQDKPCGRWSCNIHTPDWTKLIDLSVMPAAPVAGRGDRSAVLAFDVEDYVEGYEYRADEDEGSYTPNEHERALLTDAIHGVLSELSLASTAPTPQPVKMLVDQDWLNRRMETDPADMDCEASPPPQGDLAVAIKALERIRDRVSAGRSHGMGSTVYEIAAEALRTLTEKEA